MRITVTGSTGFLGRHVVNKLLERNHEVIGLSSSTDLKDAEVCWDSLAGSDCVIHLAGKIGGIGANQQFPADFFFDNITMGLNVIKACSDQKIPRLVFCGTVCSYPKFTPSPFKEDFLWSGKPEETNGPYGIAKRTLGEMCSAFHEQYGMNYIYLLPTNMYGPGDNFDPASSHIIPAAIRKIDFALKSGKVPTMWGTGMATREFLNVKDAAQAFVLAAESSWIGGPLNIGSGQCFTIAKTVEKIANMMGYYGPIHWDSTKPDGQPHRFLDCTLAKQFLGFEAGIDFDEGLQEVLVDYRERFADA